MRRGLRRLRRSPRPLGTARFRRPGGGAATPGADDAGHAALHARRGAAGFHPTVPARQVLTAAEGHVARADRSRTATSAATLACMPAELLAYEPERPVQLAAGSVATALREAKRGGAASLSGMRAEHLKLLPPRCSGNGTARRCRMCRHHAPPCWRAPMSRQKSGLH